MVVNQSRPLGTRFNWGVEHGRTDFCSSFICILHDFRILFDSADSSWRKFLLELWKFQVQSCVLRFEANAHSLGGEDFIRPLTILAYCVLSPVREDVCGSTETAWELMLTGQVSLAHGCCWESADCRACRATTMRQNVDSGSKRRSPCEIAGLQSRGMQLFKGESNGMPAKILLLECLSDRWNRMEFFFISWRGFSQVQVQCF